MNFKVNESDMKLRGGYYTPDPIALFLSRWALNKNPKKVLEPSCGDGAFIRAFLGLHHHKISFTGLELLEEEADKARFVARTNNLLNTKVINTDFLEWSLEQLNSGSHFDATIGNPPYIRYQYLEAKDQHFSELIFKRFNLPFTKHTNAWVPFVIACVALLAPGGRFAMVIPSELLHVLHATSLRSFLLEESSSIVIIDPNELLFDEALQGTVLLLLEKKVDKKKPSKGVSIVSAPNNDFLVEDPEAIFEKAVFTSGDILNGKWMKILLEPSEIEVFEAVAKSPKIKKFVDIASVDVGIVTGANKFFLVDNATISQYKLQKYARPMFGRSEHCPGIIYDEKAHKNNQAKGLPTNFLMFGNTPFEELPKKVQEYIRMGEEQELQIRYKCRMRNKIIYSVNQLGNKYGIDRTGIGFASGGTAGEVAISNPRNGYSLEFILGLLNQRVVEFYMRKRGSAFRGGYYSRGSAVVNDLPVPNIDFENPEQKEIHDRITALVTRLITIESAFDKAIGRRKENLATQRSTIKTQLKSLYDQLWNFDGEDNDLILPGEMYSGGKCGTSLIKECLTVK